MSFGGCEYRKEERSGMEEYIMGGSGSDCDDEMKEVVVEED